ncbi:MAG: tetratricopeptide repeat protein [Leptospiraceae bacterium]|nr:tetratricopeptide repeat protein [Leptospiraceae bacterium]
MKKKKYLQEIEKGNYALALSLLEQELEKQNRQNPELLYNFAICCSRTGNHKKCIQTLDEILGKFGKFIERDNVFRMLIYSEIQLENLDRALVLIEERLKYAIDDIRLLSFQAFIYEKQGLVEDAILVHRKILKVKPGYRNSLNSLSYLLVNERKPSQEELNLAVDCIKSAMKTDPSNPAYLDTFGVLLQSMGSYEQAEQALRLALKKLPGHDEILQHLADLEFKKSEIYEPIPVDEDYLTEQQSLQEDIFAEEKLFGKQQDAALGKLANRTPREQKVMKETKLLMDELRMQSEDLGL